MAKKRKKTADDKKRLRDLADQLWSLAVREDGAQRCEMCGTRSSLNAHHLIPRQHMALRHVLENGLCLCSHCHQWDSSRSPHQSAAGFVFWLQEHLPLRHEWLMKTIESGGFRRFTGTTNATYFCDVIRTLRAYVPEDEFVRVVGQRFARWLDDQQEGSDS